MTNDELLQFIEMADRYKLETLDLSNEEATTLTHSVSRWTQLPPEIGKLTRLKELNLTNNSLASLPEELFLLHNLESLCLNNNKITSIPTGIKNLRKLKKLYLRSNLIETIPIEVTELADLNLLDIGHNKLSLLPPEIDKLSNLKYLNLEWNELSSIHSRIGTLTNIKSLLIRGNSITSPPVEILDLGTKSVLDYLQAKLEATVNEWSCKLFVVGKGGAGKATLLDALGDQTREIEPEKISSSVETLVLPHLTEKDVFINLNVSDFGEHEIFHATHKFILTNRSIFLVTWDASYGFDYAKLFNLLDAIHVKTPSAPIFIVATHADICKPDLPTGELCSKYSQIVGFFNVASITGQGISELCKYVISVSSSMTAMGEEWPLSWQLTAKSIKSRTEQYVSFEEFTGIMKTNGVTSCHADTLIRWFHELGIILYFAEDTTLNKTVFMKPGQIANSIIKILKSNEIANSSGRLTSREIGAILSVQDESMQNVFCSLLQRFDIAFPLSQDSGGYTIVEHLPYESVNYENEWDSIFDKPGCKEISMEFHLDSMLPVGIPIWFVARVHRFLTNYYWQTGALLTDSKENHLALVQASTHDRYVKLAVRGPYPWNFFCILRDGLELTFGRFPGLKIIRRIPCEDKSGHVCGYKFSYEELVKRVTNNPPKKTVECPELLSRISVPYMLFGIDSSSYNSILSRIEKLTKRGTENDKYISDETSSLLELVQREFIKKFHYQHAQSELQCPNIFVVRSPDNQLELPVSANSNLYLELCCQFPGCWHPTGDRNYYKIDNPVKWIYTMKPYIHKLLSILQVSVQIKCQHIDNGDSDKLQQLQIEDINFMKQLVQDLPELNDQHIYECSIKSYSESEIDSNCFRYLRKFLEVRDPNLNHSGLKMIITPEGHDMWLCELHAKEYNQ